MTTLEIVLNIRVTVMLIITSEGILQTILSETCKHPPAKHPPAEMENAHIPPGSKTPPKTRANAPRDNTTNSRPTLCSGGHPPPSRRGRRARRPGPRTAQAACPPPQASRKHSNAQARPVHAEPPPARPPPTHSNGPKSACAKTQPLCWLPARPLPAPSHPPHPAPPPCPRPTRRHPANSGVLKTDFQRFNFAPSGTAARCLGANPRQPEHLQLFRLPGV